MTDDVPQTDTIIETPPASEPAKPKRKWTRRKTAAKGGWPKGKPRGPRVTAEVAESAIAKPPTAGNYLAGATAILCPKNCHQQRCVITHLAYCGHSCKGGLQMISMHDPGALARFNELKKMLDQQKVEIRYA